MMRLEVTKSELNYKRTKLTQMKLSWLKELRNFDKQDQRKKPDKL